MSELPESISIKEAFEFTLKLFKEQQQELTDLKAKYENDIADIKLSHAEEINGRFETYCTLDETKTMLNDNK